MKKFNIFLVGFYIVTLLLASCAARSLKCNIHVLDLLKQENIYIPHSDANGIDRYLKSSKDWHTLERLPNGKLDHQSAYTAAKSGKIVVATYNGGKNSGHIVLVVGDRKMVYSGSFKAYVPYASGSVQGKDAEITPISYQFSADKEPKMTYFVYKNQ